VADFSPDLGEAEEVTGNVEHLAPLGDALVFAKVEDDLLTISFIVLQNVGILFNNGWQNRGKSLGQVYYIPSMMARNYPHKLSLTVSLC